MTGLRSKPNAPNLRDQLAVWIRHNQAQLFAVRTQTVQHYDEGAAWPNSRPFDITVYPSTSYQNNNGLMRLRILPTT